MPQQINITMISNAAATSRLIFNPKKGKINRPTKGRVHIQIMMASAISSLYGFASGNLSAVYRILA